MKLKKVIILTIALIALFTGVAVAQEFSAEVVSTGKDGDFKGKIFVGENKVRVEAPGTVTITRMDQRVVWILMPAEKMYMEQPFDPKSIIVSSGKLPGELERTFLENELVGGKLALKYEVTYELGGIKEHLFQWLDAASKIPVKTAAMDGSWMVEYRNIQIGMQDDKLFELPKDYAKIPNSAPPVSPDAPTEPEDAPSEYGY